MRQPPVLFDSNPRPTSVALYPRQASDMADAEVDQDAPESELDVKRGVAMQVFFKRKSPDQFAWSLRLADGLCLGRELAERKKKIAQKRDENQKCVAFILHCVMTFPLSLGVRQPQPLPPAMLYVFSPILEPLS